MTSTTYERRRGQLETYFDRTAVDAWARMTSNAPLGRIRATVRAGRDRMRATLLDWLPRDLRGMRILDAGCGTGAFAIEAARRGARVVAIDLSPTLVALAHERTPTDLAGSVEYRTGDMLDPRLGEFHYAVAMDSLIHYRTADVVDALSRLSDRVSVSMLFTFAPSSAPLELMHAVGRLFPRGNRAPSIQPIAHDRLVRAMARADALKPWREARTVRIASGFYTSQAMEVVRA